MKKLKNIMLFMALTGIAGCTTFTEFSQTGDHTSAAKPNDCQFKVYSTSPHRKYHELGVIDLKPVWCITCPDKVSNVKEIVQEDVCAAGGDAILLWEANGFGMYMKATVIKLQ